MRPMIAIAALGGMFLLLGAPIAAKAQNARSWVSGAGDDSASCGYATPCRTVGVAVSKTNTGGQINCLAPGSFGSLTITKSLTISCPGLQANFSSGSGITIDDGGAGTAVVVLEGVDIDGLGSMGGTNIGVRFLSGANLTIRASRIANLDGIGVNISNAANAKVDIIDTMIANATQGGILAKPGANATLALTLTNVQATKNLFGLRAEDRAKVTASNSNFSSNTNNGVVATGSLNAVVNLDSSVIANNGTNGVLASGVPAVNVRIVRSTITNNGTGLNASGGTITTSSPPTNLVIGNSTNGAFTATLNLQ